MVDFSRLPPKAKTFLNSLKCPLCGSAVDLTAFQHRLMENNLKCSRKEHYFLDFEWDDSSQGIFGETIWFDVDGIRYCVERKFENTSTPQFAFTWLKGFAVNGDGEIDLMNPTFSKILKGVDVFDFRQRIITKEAAKKIQTILIFQ